MAYKCPILLVLVSSITVAVHARVQQLNSCNNPQGRGIMQTGACINTVRHGTRKDTRIYASTPDDVEEGDYTTPTPIPNAKQQYILDVVVVMMILTLISSCSAAVIRIICRRVGQERLDTEENDPAPIELESVDLERPSYEPRPLREGENHYKLIICHCNTFSVCGQPF